MTESRVLTPISTFIDLNCYLKFKKYIYKLKKKKKKKPLYASMIGF